MNQVLIHILDIFNIENSSDKFDIGHYRVKVKVTAGVQTVFPFTAIQTVRSYNSTLVKVRKLILSFYVHLIPAM